MQTNPKEFIEASLNGLAEQTAAHDEAWGIGTAQRWDANLDTGEITFTLGNDTTAVAPLQIVGTYDAENGTWLWGWDHPSVPSPLRNASELARSWGSDHNLEFYTSPRLKCPEEQAWEFTAVAARLSEANGAFRGTSGATQLFMTFGEIKLFKP
ncbi:MAG: hypothetical protein JST22_17970 [Bacteroidetes bacterium]|nr:hypothetical protein [Bacteroidota bacterium]